MVLLPVHVSGEIDGARLPDGGSTLSLALGARITALLHNRIAGLGERTPAELSFANLWLFRGIHSWRFHEGLWPCISGLGYDGRCQAIPLFDVRRPPVRVLSELLRRHGCLYPLCEPETAALDQAYFTLTAQRDDADYLYRAIDLAHFQGKGLHSKRNLMATFTSTHDVRAQAYEISLHDEALEVLAGWMQDKGLQSGEADDTPCRDALAHAAILGLKGFVYRVDGEVAGFLLAEMLQAGLWIIRFAKARLRFKGLAQFMFHHFAACSESNATWLNFEQDLGLLNFRQTKMSYRPTILLPKWRLSLRDDHPIAARTGAKHQGHDFLTDGHTPISQ